MDPKQILQILQIIFAVLTILFGVVAIARPVWLSALMKWRATNKIAAVEVQVNWGGMIFALGVASLITSDYRVLGAGYAGAGLVRIIQMFRDRAVIIRPTAIAFTFELISAIVFLTPLSVFT